MFGKLTSLKQQLRVHFVILGLLVALVGNGVVWVYLGSVLRTSAEQQLVAINTAKGRAVHNWLDERLRDVRTVSELPLVRRYLRSDPDSISRYFANLKTIFQIYQEIAIFSTKGSPLASSGLVISTQNRAQMPYFIRAMQGQTGFQNIYFSPEYQAILLSVSAPIYDQPPDPIDRRTIGVAVLHVRLDDTLWKILTDRTGLGETGESYLVKYYNDGTQLQDTENPVLASPSRFSRDLLRLGFKNPQDPLDYVLNTGLPLETEAVKAALSGNSGTLINRDYRGKKVLSAYHFIPGQQDDLRWALISQIDLGEVLAPRWRLMFSLILIEVILIFGLMMVLTGVLLRQIKPVLMYFRGTLQSALRGEPPQHGVPLPLALQLDEFQPVVTDTDQLLQILKTATTDQAHYRQLQHEVDQFIERFSLPLAEQMKSGTAFHFHQLEGLSAIYHTLRNTLKHVQEALDRLQNELVQTHRESKLIAERVQKDASHHLEQFIELKPALNAVHEVQVRLKTDVESTVQLQREFQESVLRNVETISETVKRVDRLYQQTQAVAQTAEYLAGQIQRLEDGVQTIGEMASQISMLALNANIEATRAGEQGQGFAIVAAKIQTMGERAVTVSQDMVTGVRSLQTGAQEMNEATTAQQRAMDEAVQQIERAQSTLHSLEIQTIQVSDQLKAHLTDVKVQENHVSTLRHQFESLQSRAQRISSDLKPLQELLSQLAQSMAYFQQIEHLFQSELTSRTRSTKLDPNDTDD
ncbi:MAG: hypothetical protein D6675_14520 [Gemmatimonadetes bacterium]|nr:MAG: hypothetical protein D6675_14520 [Gemmatimonadota bacterium]